MFRLKLLLCLLFITSICQAQSNYYVSTTGSNSNDGSLSNPWQTIQHAVSQLTSGDNLYIMQGTYNGKIDVNISGAQTTTITNHNNDEVIINGNGLNNNEYLLKIENANRITIDGIKFQDYQKLYAVGITVINSSNITLTNNSFSNIDYSPTALGETPNETQNSQPIIVFGRDASQAIQNLKIHQNTVSNCETGYSESISVNGNVDGFEITNNTVFDNTNIGIVAIGFEGECPDPTVDQARNGLIKNNLVYNNQSPYAAAGGLYVDGGRDITVENNISYNNDYGIEIGCENNGAVTTNPTASSIIVRNNLVYNNKYSGIALGGYNFPTTGKVETTTVTNNTFYNNDTGNGYNGEISLSSIDNSVIENNIFYSKNTEKVMLVASKAIPTVQFNYNIYYAPSGSFDVAFEINGTGYYEYNSYVSGTSQDANSQFINPQFVDENTSNPDLHLNASSPAIDGGNPSFTPDPFETDIDTQVRVHNSIVDCGADEYGSVLNIIEQNNDKLLTIFPNPVSSQLYIQSNQEFSYLKIFDITGKEVQQDSFKQIVNVANLKSGIYFIKLYTEEDKVIIKKIIKN